MANFVPRDDTTEDTFLENSSVSVALRCKFNLCIKFSIKEKYGLPLKTKLTLALSIGVLSRYTCTIK